MKISAKSSSKAKSVNKVSGVKPDPQRVQKLKEEVESTKEQVRNFKDILDDKKRELFLEIVKPFKPGDRVLAEVPCGKQRKEKECELVLGCSETGTYHFRLAPITEEGKKASRSFIVYDYPEELSKVLKPIK